MEEAKALAQQQQQLMQQQQMLLFQQLQQQQQQQQQQQKQKQQQQAAISRFPSNIDAHLRPMGLNRSLSIPQNPKPNPTPGAMLHYQQSQPPHSNTNANSSHQMQLHQHHQQQQEQQQHQQQHHHHQQQQQQQQQQQLQEQKAMSSGGATPTNQAELQMAYQDAWRVCHPDFKRPFASLEDACERLLPYHVVADYEAEEDHRILDSDTTGQMPSRSQQWDHNIAAKVSEFTGTFEKQALAFNIITRKRAMGEFRSEERLMIEQSLLQEEKRAVLEMRAEMELREKAGREAQEAKFRMAAFQAEQARVVESQSHAEMMARAPIRASALGSQGKDSSVHHEMSERDQGINNEEMMNGWGNNSQRDEKEPSEDFLNDDEAENGDTGVQDWRGGGEFDLNSR